MVFYTSVLHSIWPLYFKQWLVWSCAKYGDSASVSVARVMWTYVNSSSEENWKKFSSSTTSPEALFNGDSKEENLYVSKTRWK